MSDGTDFLYITKPMIELDYLFAYPLYTINCILCCMQIEFFQVFCILHFYTEIEIICRRYNLVGSGSLSIREVRQSDEGRYQCVTRNIVGSRTSTTALLRVTSKPKT